MDKHLLSRRQFGARCAALGLVIAAQAGAEDPGSGAAPKPAVRTVKLPDGTAVTPLGQGGWHLGQGSASSSTSGGCLP